MQGDQKMMNTGRERKARKGKGDQKMKDMGRERRGR